MNAESNRFDEELIGRLERVSGILDELGPEVIGPRVRRLRDLQGLSIREVAERASISKNSIVRLELGRGTQPITILKICAILGVHIERLADPADEDVIAIVHNHSDDRWFDVANMVSDPLLNSKRPLTARQRKQAVAAGAQVPVNLLKCRLPGGKILPCVLELHGPSPTRSHVGEEFVYVISGAVIVTISDKKHRLKEGESMSFWSAEPHSYAPAGPKKTPAKILSVRVEG